MDEAGRERATAGPRDSRSGGQSGLGAIRAEIPSSSVTAIRAPKGMDSGVIVKEYRNRFGSIIANGQGSMKGQIFRIAHLGYFDFSDLFAIIAQLEIILAANGVPVEYRQGCGRRPERVRKGRWREGEQSSRGRVIRQFRA